MEITTKPTIQTTRAISPTLSTLTVSKDTIPADGGQSSSIITLTLKDYAGQPVEASNISITTNNGSYGTITKDPTNGGVTTATLKSTTQAGVNTITAVANGVTISTKPTITTVATISPTRSTLTVSPTSIVADGNSTSTITLTLLDYAGRPISVDAANITITTDKSASGVITKDSTNGNETKATLTSTTTSGINTITAVAGGVEISAKPTIETTRAISPTQSTLTVSKDTIPADGGQSSSIITLTLKDYAGQLVETSNISITTNNGAYGTITKDSTNGGVTTATLKSTTQEGVNTITAVANGVTITAKPTIKTVATVSPARSTLTISSTSIDADGVSKSTITVQLKDYSGTNIDGEAGKLKLTSNGANITPNKTGTGLYTYDFTTTTAGSYAIAATYNNDSIGNATISAGVKVSAANSTLTVSKATINADNSDSSTITIELKDYSGAAADGSNLVLTIDGATVAPVKEAGSTGKYTYAFKTITYGTYSVVATYDGTPINGSPKTIDANAVVSAEKSTLTVSPNAIDADGVSKSTIRVQLNDYSGKPIDGEAGKLKLTSNGANITPDNAGTGLYTYEFTTTTAGSYAIAATYNNDSIGNAAINAGVKVSAANSTLTVSKATINADNSDSSTITIELKDYSGAAADGSNLVLTIDGATVAPVKEAGSTGKYTYAFKTITYGTYSVVATYGGTPINGSPKSINANAVVSAEKSTLTVLPNAIDADGVSKSTITVQLNDYDGKPIDGTANLLKLTSTINGQENALTLTKGTDTGLYTHEFTTRVAGSYAIAATYNNDSIGNTAINAGVKVSAANSTLTVSKTTINANNSDSSIITIQLKDYSNDDADGSNLVLTIDGATVTPVKVTGSTGKYTYTFKTIVSGTHSITATYDGTVISGSPKSINANAVVSAEKSTLTVSPNAIDADGVSKSTIRVQLNDYDGKAIDGIASLLKLTSTMGSTTNDLQFSKGDGIGLYTYDFTTTTAGSYAIAATYNNDSIGNTAINAGVKVSAANSTLTVSKPTINANNSDSSIITIQLKDYSNDDADGSNLRLTIDGAVVTPVKVTDSTGKYTYEFKTIVSGTHNVVATYDGTAIKNSPASIDANAVVSAEKSTLTVSPNAIDADGVSKSTIRVQLKDYSGANIDGTANLLKLTSTMGSTTNDLQFSKSTGIGLYTYDFTTTTAGSYTIAATYSNDSIGNAAINAGAKVSAANSILTVSKTIINANNSDSSIITIELKDYSGAAADGSNLVLTIDGATVTPAKDTIIKGKYTYTFKTIVSGDHNVVATYDGTAIKNSPASIDANAVVSAEKSTLTVSPNAIDADGVSKSTIRVQLKDYSGANIDGTANLLKLTSTMGSTTNDLQFSKSTGIGLYTYDFTTTTAGSYTIAATYSNDSIGNAAINAGAKVSAANSILTVSKTSINADNSDSSIITIQLKDYSNDDADGSNLVLTIDGATVTPAKDTIIKGKYTYTFKTITSGDHSVVATYGGVAISGSPKQINATAVVSAEKSTLTVSPNAIDADGVSKSIITVQLKDYSGANIDGTANLLKLTSTMGSTTNDLQFSKSTGIGLYTYDFTTTTAGSYTIAATYSNDSIGNAAINAGAKVSAANSILTVSKTSINADNSDSSIITIELKDYSGAAADGSNLVLTIDGATVTPAKDTIIKGKYTYTFKTIVSGDHNVVATYGGVAISGSPKSINANAVVSAEKSTLTVLPNAIDADGVSKSIITVQLKDYSGANIEGEADKLKLTSNGANITPNNSGTGLYTYDFTTTTAGSYTIAATYSNDRIGNTTITANAKVNAANSILTVSKTSINANNSDSSIIRIELKDYSGTAVNGTLSELKLIATIDGKATELTPIKAAQVGVYNYTFTTKVYGVHNITATYGGVAISGSPKVINAIVTADTDKSTLTVSPASINADGVSASIITVQLNDYDGNPIDGTDNTLELTATIDGQKTVLPLTKGAGIGSYTSVFKTIVAGNYTIKATYGGIDINGSTKLINAIGVVNIKNSTVTVSPSVIDADGVSKATVTIVLKDYNNENIDGILTNIKLSTGYTSYPFKKVATGVYTYDYTTTTVSTNTLTASYKIDNTYYDIGSVTITSIEKVNMNNSTFVAFPVNVLANGINTIDLTFTAKDYNDKQIDLDASKLSFISNNGTISSIQNFYKGIYTATFKTTIVGEHTITARYDGADIKTIKVSAVTEGSGLVSTEYSSIMVTNNGATIAIDGNIIVNVKLRDMFNEPITDKLASIEANVTVPGGTKISWYEDKSNNIYIGTYKATSEGSNLYAMLSLKGWSEQTGYLVSNLYSVLMPKIKHAVARGYEFQPDIGFPTTAYAGLTFSLDLNELNVIKEYTWRSNNSNIQVDSSATGANVTILNPELNGIDIIITGTPTSPDSKRHTITYKFKIKKAFKRMPNLVSAGDASNEHFGSVCTLPQANQLSSGKNVRGVGSLYGEWGSQIAQGMANGMAFASFGNNLVILTTGEIISTGSSGSWGSRMCLLYSTN